MKIAKLVSMGILVPGILFSAAVASENYLVLGTKEDEEGLIYFPRQVEEGQLEEQVYILDSGDSFIKVFDSNGKFLRKFGGQGEGPGEFQRD